MNQRDLIYEQKRPTIRAKETYYTSGSFFFSEAIVPTAALQAFAQQLSAGAATRLGRQTACAEPSKRLKRPTICGIMIACRKSTRKGKRKGTQNGNGKRKKKNPTHMSQINFIICWSGQLVETAVFTTCSQPCLRPQVRVFAAC